MDFLNKLSIFLVFIFLSFGVCEELEPKHNKTATISGKPVVHGIWNKPISFELAKALATEDATWHWIPWHRVRTELRNGIYEIKTCERIAVRFPENLFTDKQLRQGAIILYFFAVLYAFTLLAIICNDYFIPTVECICNDFNLPKDVAAATFMATATSFPEFFTNIMGTFITKSDLGIGTIIGAALFNTLCVSAIGGLFAVRPIIIDKIPMARDCSIYIFNVLILLGIVWDGFVYWYEGMILVLIYLFYFITMLNSPKLSAFIKRKFKKDDIQKQEIELGPVTPVILEPDAISMLKVEATEVVVSSIWKFPKNDTMAEKLWFIYSWPIKFCLTMTVPNPLTRRRLYPLTFILCIVWLGFNSYFVSWMITVIGDIFYLSDSVMGITLLAFGGCMPEACTMFIMARRGEGGMGISNIMGSNSLAIIFSLGMPWFIKATVLAFQGEGGFIDMDSEGIAYTVGLIIFSVLTLCLVLIFGKYTLRKLTGFFLFLGYIVFLSIALMIELGVFFDVVLPACGLSM